MTGAPLKGGGTGEPPGGLNLVVMGAFSYPRGMAGTRRVQNVTDSLRQYPDVSVRVILQRQSSRDNPLDGEYRGVPYQTVMGDLMGVRMLLGLPRLCRETVALLQKALRPGEKNVLYFYGCPFLDSVLPLRLATRLGYRVVFDVVEDHALAGGASSSFYEYARGILASRLWARYCRLASGMVAVSSYLEGHCRELTGDRTPVHPLPVSVDLAHFPQKDGAAIGRSTLFYAGSFARKDGLCELLDAFDLLAPRHPQLRLVLTGRGEQRCMEEFHQRVARSPHKERIEYMGYLEDEDYYRLLNEVDIPCMTRADLPFAHAGFPFKLGEFLATGKPVIASRLSDVGRYLADRENAMLVQPGSTQEICQAVDFILGNPAAARQIGVRGRATAERFFDYRRQGEALREFLLRV